MDACFSSWLIARILLLGRIVGILWWVSRVILGVWLWWIGLGIWLVVWIVSVWYRSWKSRIGHRGKRCWIWWYLSLTYNISHFKRCLVKNFVLNYLGNWQQPAEGAVLDPHSPEVLNSLGWVSGLLLIIL